MKLVYSVFAGMCLLLTLGVVAQKKEKQNLVYVDKAGVLRYTDGGKEATFFGVNYTVPFAYGYRSHKALGVNIEQAIDADVYHMARLGLNAFRVHVWDVELSDSLGNLLQNEHLRLFDYLIKKLKEHNIKILLTPIAFWGSGYPEPDVKTAGFSYVYTKSGAVVTEAAFKAQEHYLKQFFNHVNQYTRQRYKDDPDIIAMEINNEPQHSGRKSRTTEYITRMAAAVKSTGWTKPIFYNISESPRYTDAIVKAPADGHSFQWYPTGLVRGSSLQGNFLPHIDKYNIPFGDSIKAFNKRGRMVYEFDAGDVAQPIMYPAMARSFRTAGFSWATQFAYDPMYTAHANTEYQTHYLNLAYTPAKAISLLIAAKVFTSLPRLKNWGAFPADTVFDAFRISYTEGLSEMNSDTAFYYTGNTSTISKNIGALKHIAGTGHSSVIKYEGTGAYFFDQLAEGVWRLELMPDAIAISDPFAKASPKKTVTSIQWQKNYLQILLPQLQNNVQVQGINAGNNFSDTGTTLQLHPGVYIIRTNNKVHPKADVSFFAPLHAATEPVVVHQPYQAVTANKMFVIAANIIGVDSADTIEAELRTGANKWQTVALQHSGPYAYHVTVPQVLATPGIINYRIIVRKKSGGIYTFPGGYKGNPYAWDEYRNETWQTAVMPAGSPVVLFDATANSNEVISYNTDWRANSIHYSIAQDGSGVLQASLGKTTTTNELGFQFYFANAISGRKNDVALSIKLLIRARSATATKAQVSLISKHADAYGTIINLLPEWQEYSVPLNTLQKMPYLLLPRPYPSFQPLYFNSAAGTRPLHITDAEKLEVKCTSATLPASIEVAWVKLVQ